MILMDIDKNLCQMLQAISDSGPEAPGIDIPITDVCDITPICIRDGVKTNKLPS